MRYNMAELAKLPWTRVPQELAKCVESSLLGSVATSTQVFDLIRAFEVATSTHFVVLKKSVDFGAKMEPPEVYRIRFKEVNQGEKSWKPTIPEDGVPFIITGKAEFMCHFGPDKHVKEKRALQERITAEEKGDHPNARKRRKLVQVTKKKSCTAKISVKEILRFPEYMVTDRTSRSQKIMSESLRDALQKSSNIQKEHVFFIRLPSQVEHINHHVGQLSAFMHPLSHDIKGKVAELVGEGVVNISEMRRHLNIFVDSLFDESRPAITDSAFYPSDQTLRNHIYMAQLRQRYSKYDQENLLQKVEEWKERFPEDNFVFRPCSNKPSAEVDIKLLDTSKATSEDEELTPRLHGKALSSSFFFCHQTKHQQHLLRRYGNIICLLDATYKTTQYALPLFFVAVKTNVGYAVVAEFVTQLETKEAIREGLQTVKSWMQHSFKADWVWQPEFFMTDFSEAEIGAIEDVFPDCEALLCDFHREQSWGRWLSKTKNGVSAIKYDVLCKLRRCAHASTVLEFDLALEDLKRSDVWQHNKALESWFSKTWLPEKKRWVWAFRRDRGLLVNTNNGLERINQTFKYRYLEKKRSNTLSQMISVLITEYLPSMLKQYVCVNSKAMESIGKSYSVDLPSFLKNRPSWFVLHCLGKIQLGETIPPQHVTRETKLVFHVKSQELGSYALEYKVSLANTNMPSCECHAWRRTHLPCKHMFAVLYLFEDVSWNCMPSSYTDSPLFTLDKDLFDIYDTNFHEVTKENILEEEEASTQIPSFDDDSLPKSKRPPKYGLKSIALQCREKLDQLRSATFLCQEVISLRALSAQLDPLLILINEHLYDADGLVLEPTIPLKKKNKLQLARTPVTENTWNCIKQLPLETRKRKRGVLAAKQHPIFCSTDSPIESSEIVEVEGHACIPEYTKDNANEGMESKSEDFTRLPVLDKLDDKSNASGLQQTASLSPLSHLHKDVLCRLSEVYPPSEGPLFIGDLSLSIDDFLCLWGDEYLNDKNIDAYLQLLCKESAYSACALTSFLPCKWASGDFNCWVFGKKKLTSFMWVLVPVCVLEHWCLIVANIKDKTVAVIDSLQNTQRAAKYVKFWRIYMKERAKSGKVCTSDTSLEDGWQTVSLKCTQQKDLINCGVFLLMNAEALLKGYNLRCVSAEQKYVRLYRNYILHRLLEAAEKE